ncbi:unnamed protein product [Rhizoctonia solani]|uniref:Uncharacterized protein n=1 Tax=Rhizoctonia solani TaxID=456999 RepID=A0A8H3HPS0_9AGAM|nr:unnamed protein product [Rhizoctonia solani]
MESMERSSFEKIYDDIRVMMLHFSSLQTILRFAVTSRRNYNLVKTSNSLQLQIELEINGLEIVGTTSNGSSRQQILGELIQYRNAWLDLNILPPAVGPVLQEDMKCWQMYEGHWASGFSHHRDRPDSLQTINLDSSTLPPPVDFQTEYDQFTVDPNQQLVALLAASQKGSDHVHIHLRSLVTGMAHPRARLPTLTAILPKEHRADLSRDIKRLRLGPLVMGNILVINVGYRLEWTFCVLIWDWMAGVLLGHIPGIDGFCDARFLDSNHLVLYTAFKGESDSDEESDGASDSESQDSADRQVWSISLEVYVVPPTRTRTGCYLPPGTQFEVFKSDILCPKISFRLPHLDTGFSIVPCRTLLWSGPTPGSVTYTSHSAQFACQKVSTLALTLTLTKQWYFGTSFHSEGAHVGSLYYRIFVDMKYLFSHFPIEGRQRAVRWNEWGEQATRWFKESPGSLDYRGCWGDWASGSRFVKGNFDDEGVQTLSVFDFNPLTIGRHFNRSRPCYIQALSSSQAMEGVEIVRRGGGLFVSQSVYDTLVVKSPSFRHSNKVFVDFVGRDQPTTIDEGFQDYVQSRLPYRIVTRACSVLPSAGWFLDGTRIITIQQYTESPWEFCIFRLNINDVIDSSDD